MVVMVAVELVMVLILLELLELQTQAVAEVVGLVVALLTQRVAQAALVS
jgi:hypothetical protein